MGRPGSSARTAASSCSDSCARSRSDWPSFPPVALGFLRDLAYLAQEQSANHDERSKWWTSTSWHNARSHGRPSGSAASPRTTAMAALQAIPPQLWRTRLPCHILFLGPNFGRIALARIHQHIAKFTVFRIDQKDERFVAES